MTTPIANTNTAIELDHVDAQGRLSAEHHRWIGRCKRCGRTHRLEGRIMVGRRGTQGYQVIKADDGLVFMSDDLGSNPYAVRVRCGDHWCRLQMVHEGTKASKHECGARCVNATGPSCDCRCKGANHGSGATLVG